VPSRLNTLRCPSEFNGTGVNRKKLFRGFVFDDYDVIDHHVNAEAQVNFDFLIRHREQTKYTKSLFLPSGCQCLSNSDLDIPACRRTSFSNESVISCDL